MSFFHEVGNGRHGVMGLLPPIAQEVVIRSFVLCASLSNAYCLLFCYISPKIS